MRDRQSLGRLVSTVFAVLGGLAVVKELRTPRRRRRWHGTILGVPYDFRRPTFKRARSRLWNPRDKRLFTPRTFGVGWDVNFARLLRR
jgi:hypothetical protein